MSVSWKTGVGRSLILAVVASACGGFEIYKARQFAKAVQGERTTTIPEAYAHCRETYAILGFLRGSRYSCGYSFNVDGTSYHGRAYCPQPSATATVYYNPADPSLNSLLDLSLASEQEYREATLWIGMATLIGLSFIFFAALAAGEKKGTGGVVVDFGGTVIYPEQINLGSKHGGQPGGSRNASGNIEAANAANFASSPALRELYLEVVNQVHPDRASNEVDLALRERLMKEANAAFERSDADSLRRVMEQYRSAIPTS